MNEETKEIKPKIYFESDKFLQNHFIVKRNGVCIMCSGKLEDGCYASFGATYIDCDKAKQFGLSFFK